MKNNRIAPLIIIALVIIGLMVFSSQEADAWWPAWGGEVGGDHLENPLVLPEPFNIYNDISLRDSLTVGGSLIVDTGGLYWNAVTNKGAVGGLLDPDGTWHVHVATAGDVTAHTNADDLIIENSGIAGLSILTPDANSSYILFGSKTDNYGAVISYNYTGASLDFGTHRTGGYMAFLSGTGTEAMRIDGNQDIAFGETVPLANTVTIGDGLSAGLLVTMEHTPAGTDSSGTLSVDGGDFTITGTAGDGDTSSIMWDTNDQIDIAGATGGFALGSDTPFVITPSGLQTLEAGTTVADDAGTIQVVGSGGAVTLTATPTISAGVDGQRLLIRGTHDTNTVTFQDVANLGTGALWLGGVDFTMTQGDRLLLEYDGTLSVWVEISRTDN